MAEEKLKRELGFRDVILFYIVSGLSLRWIATAAAAGQSAIAVAFALALLSVEASAACAPPTPRLPAIIGYTA